MGEAGGPGVLHHPKIRQHVARAPAGIVGDQHVARFDVTVHQGFLMRETQGCRNLPRNQQRLCLGHELPGGPQFAHRIRQRFTQQLHRDEVLTLGGVRLKHLNDVGVAQVHQRFGFAQKTADVLNIGGQ